LFGPRALITKWSTFVWEEMLWKSCAEKFLSESRAPIAAKKYDLHKHQSFSMGLIYH